MECNGVQGSAMNQGDSGRRTTMGGSLKGDEAREKAEGWLRGGSFL